MLHTRSSRTDVRRCFRMLIINFATLLLYMVFHYNPLFLYHSDGPRLDLGVMIGKIVLLLLLGCQLLSN